jgi:hypothetical protein
VEGGFASSGFGFVDPGAGFDEELTEAPVSVERGCIEFVIEAGAGFPPGKEIAYCADVAIISAPLDEGDAVSVGGIGGMPLREIFKDEVRASVGDLIEHEQFLFGGVRW